MTFGIHVGHLGGPLEEMRRLWRFADEKGFDWFSVSDHFQETPPRGGDRDCYEAVSTMTAAALETAKVRIGCLVFSIGYRSAGLLAKALASIDRLSHGRAECGIGTGWHEGEYRAFGIPFPRIGVREDQLEEYARILRLLFDGDAVTFQGRHFQLRDARCRPRPEQRHLRIWIGGGGEKRTLRAVARYADGWNVPYLSPGEWKAKNEILDRWCEKEGRDPQSIERTANVGFYVGADSHAASRQKRAFEEHWAGELEKPRGFLFGTPKDARETVEAYQKAGVARLNIALREGPYDWEALEAFAEEIAPG